MISGTEACSVSEMSAWLKQPMFSRSAPNEGISIAQEHGTRDSILADDDNIQPVILFFLDLRAGFTAEQFDELWSAMLELH